jgi:TPR repeat protein
MNFSTFSKAFVQDKAIQIIEESINQKTKTQIYSDLYVRLTCALYANGKGVERSIETAREWWMKSAKQEDEDAIRSLQQLDEIEGRTTPSFTPPKR